MSSRNALLARSKSAGSVLFDRAEAAVTTSAGSASSRYGRMRAAASSPFTLASARTAAPRTSPS